QEASPSMNRLDRKREQIFSALIMLNDPAHRGPLLAAHLMTPDPVCITSQTTVLDLVKTFHTKAFRHLLVSDVPGKLLGVISDRDVLRSLGPKNSTSVRLPNTAAADLMSTDLVTTSPATTVEQATALVVDQGISCLPVVNDGYLVGILTSTDLQILL